MWTEDIIKVLRILNKNCCIDKIENGIIYFSDHSFYIIKNILDNTENK